MLKNKNFAVSKLLSGITDAATQLTVLADEGSKFPTTGTFRAVIWSQSYESPIQDGTREIVTMQLSAGDVFTITRAQESTSAKAWNANDNVAHVLTAGKVDELETEINAKKTDNVSATNKVLGRVSAGAGAIEEIPLPLAVNKGGTGVSTYSAFSVHKNDVAQTIPSGGGDIKLTWSTEIFDVNEEFADNKFTPKVAGTYQLIARARFAPLNDAKIAYISICKNGALSHFGDYLTTGVAAGLFPGVVVLETANGSTDYFEVFVWHNNSANLDVSGAASGTYFMGHRIGA